MSKSEVEGSGAEANPHAITVDYGDVHLEYGSGVVMVNVPAGTVIVSLEAIRLLSKTFWPQLEHLSVAADMLVRRLPK